MSFEPITQPEEAYKAIQDFMRSKEGRALPDDIQERVWGFLTPGGEAGNSVSFTAAYFVELMYARKADVTKPALKLAAQVAAYTNMHSVDNLGGKRGTEIMLALRRRSGETAPEGLSWPDAKDDPESRENMRLVEAVPEQPALPPPE